MLVFPHSRHIIFRARMIVLRWDISKLQKYVHKHTAVPFWRDTIQSSDQWQVYGDYWKDKRDTIEASVNKGFPTQSGVKLQIETLDLDGRLIGL